MVLSAIFTQNKKESRNMFHGRHRYDHRKRAGSIQDLRCVNEDVYNFSNYYVTNYGEVYKVADGGYALMRHFPTHNGYHRVRLVGDDGIRYGVRINRLVLMAFAARPDMCWLEADHCNGDKSDNRLSNLRWMNSDDNIRMYHANTNFAHAYESLVCGLRAYNEDPDIVSNWDGRDDLVHGFIDEEEFSENCTSAA